VVEVVGVFEVVVEVVVEEALQVQVLAVAVVVEAASFKLGNLLISIHASRTKSKTRSLKAFRNFPSVPRTIPFFQLVLDGEHPA
jgi:hypothetical protein